MMHLPLKQRLVGPVRVLAIVTLLTPSISRASFPTIQNIIILGNTTFTSRQLVEDMSSRTGRVVSPTVLQSDIRSIMERYRHAGYIDATVVTELVYTQDSANVDVRLSVDEGRQVIVGNILLSGQLNLTSKDILSLFDTKPGKPLDELVLERDIDELLVRYERTGLPLATCEVTNILRRIGVEQDSLDLSIAIDEGQRITIDEIQVLGNKETDPAVVVRETRLRVGETFSPLKVDAIRQRVQRLNIFSDVSEPQLYTRNNKGGLLIKVREGNTNTFDGVLGYIPATISGESGYVTGLASVSMRNLFGTGRKLSVHWQREDRNSQELGVRYVEPWIFSLPVNVGGGFFQRQQDSSYVKRVVDLKAELMFSEELSASVLYGSENVIPSADTMSSRVYRSATTTFGVELQYDTRDDLYSPTRGARYSTDYSFGRKRMSNIPAALSGQVPGHVTVQRFALDLDVFLSTFTRQVFAFGVHGRELRSGQIEEGDLFHLGGTRTLRGYRENQFIGSRIGWTNTEYRFLLARRSFIYGFVDGGYYLRLADVVRGIETTDAFKFGYGIGVQLETALGNLGVSLALGKGDTFGTAKIHFGLINEF